MTTESMTTDSMKIRLLMSVLGFFAVSALADDRDNNLQVLSDADYRQSLQEIVVIDQATAPDWNNSEKTAQVAVALPSARLQWFPTYDPDKATQKPIPNPNDEQPLIQIFKKIF